LSEEEQQEMKHEASYMMEEMMYGSEGYEVSLAGATKIDGVMHYILDVTNPFGKTQTEYFSAETGLKTKKVESMETPQGEMSILFNYSNYKEVKGGLKVPSEITQNVGPTTLKLTLVYLDVKKKFDTSYLSE